MAKQTLKSMIDIEDFVRGVTFYGTGGGGRPEDGIAHLSKCLNAGFKIAWEEPADLPDEIWTCAVFGMGSIAPAKKPEKPPYGISKKIVDIAMVEAVRRLEEYTGVKVGAIVPFELGGANTPKAMSAAYHLGARVPDGDMCGRAVPELTQTTAALAGISPVPVAIADDWGNVMIVKAVPTLEALEAIGKMVSIVTKAPDPSATCAHAAYLMKAADLKKTIVAGTLSKALEVGRAIRLARERASSPVGEVCRVTGGTVLFKGKVTEKAWKSEQGYMFGTTTVRGTGEFEGSEFKVWFKNENHVVWQDGAPICMSPDLVCIVREHDGEPLTNTVLAEGDEVACIATPNQRYRTREGIAALGPGHFGFDFEYVPFGEGPKE